MNNMDAEGILVFTDEPLATSQQTVTLSILSQENALKGPDGTTRGSGSPPRTIYEGNITFNPRGDRIAFIPPAVGADPDPLIGPDRKRWDLYLVSQPFTLHAAPDNRYYEQVKFSIELLTPGAVAFDLFPDGITTEVETTKTYTLSPQIRFKEIEASLGQIGKQLQFRGLRPTITAFGGGEHKFYWIHQGYREQKAVAPGTKQALMVLQVPRGTRYIEGKISAGVVIMKKMLEWRRKDGFVPEYAFRWELQDTTPFFQISAGESIETGIEHRPSHFDVCFFCALAEEAEVCMQEIKRRCGVSFRSGYNLKTGTYYYTTIRNVRGEPLTIHVSWQSKPGPVEAGLHIKPVLAEFQPYFATMTGICAGDRSKVKLGDLIVAESAFPYDTGKVVEKHNQAQLLHDADLWHPFPDVLHFARMFQDWKLAVANIQPSLPAQPAVHIAPMASGSAVRGDNPFEQVRMMARNTVAIDMEAATFYRTIAEYPGVRGLLVKGVSDYADNQKNDTYHTYAAAAATAYMLSFVQAYVTSERIAALRIV